MVLYPDVQAKARAEIDRVIGRNRLPVPEDRPNLPYMEALLLEVWRWNMVAPQGAVAVIFSRRTC
jgi:cytochrome P450